MNKIFSQIEISKDTFEVVINYNNLILDKKKIGLSIGYLNGDIPPHFDEILETLISKLPKYCEIKAGFRLVDIQYSFESPNGLFVASEFFEMDKIVTSQLKKATKGAIFLCTIGPKMETWGKQVLKGGDPILSYLIDITASAIVESVADNLHDHIGAEMKNKGFKITNRYSPGYCNWSVLEQKKIFSLLPPKFCGILLNESALMTPIKSISGVIGIGTEVKYSEYICDRCGIKDCTHRTYLLAKKQQQTKSI